MYNKLYSREAKLNGMSVLEVFRKHHKSVKAGINTIEEYRKKLILKEGEKQRAKKEFLMVTLPKIKEANRRREAAYLAAIGKL